MDSFDYVIVGGGTAASIMAYRLAEKGRSVCVLEAGPPDDNPLIRVPAGFVKTLFHPRLTWQLAYDPSPATNNRPIQVTQGKTLGGSSAVNGMIYNRGQAADYDGWAQAGNRGWSYPDILPYFRRTERRVGPGDDRYRGREGRLTTSSYRWPSAIVEAFVKSAQEAGFPFNPDYNGEKQEGVGYYQSAIDRGFRVSTATAFLHPARRQFNVDVRTRALVTRVLIEGRRAAGVEYLLEGTSQTRQVNARQSVIIAAGVTNSPKVLQLSGIGPAQLLRAHGIEVRHDLPGVGENFRDHYSPRLVARAKNGVDSINNHVTGLPLAIEVVRWLMRRPSVLSLSPALVHLFGKTDSLLDNPNFSLVFSPGSFKQGFIGVLDDFPGLTCGAWQMRPQSRGYVRIKSADPRIAPAVNPNYLAEETDRVTLVAALKIARRILQGEPLKPLVEREIFPGPDVQSDDEWLAFARQYGNSSYHLVGSCKMGPGHDTLAVVDERLCVHGLEGLRVADASIMPAMPSCNTYAPTMMIAEKASDMILEDAAAPARQVAA